MSKKSKTKTVYRYSVAMDTSIGLVWFLVDLDRQVDKDCMFTDDTEPHWYETYHAASGDLEKAALAQFHKACPTCNDFQTSAEGWCLQDIVEVPASHPTVDCTSDSPETKADDPVKDLFDNLTPVAYLEQLAITAFQRCIPDAKFDPISISTFNDGGQAIDMDIPFVLGGTKFICRFKTMWKCTDKEWEHFMFIWPEADESDEISIKDPYNARQELVNFYFTLPYFVERKFKDRLPDFTEKSVNLAADGSLEWKGTFRGKEIAIEFKDGLFSFGAKGKTEKLSGGGLSFFTLKGNLDSCIVESDQACPLCSGKDVTFGSNQFTFCRPGNGNEVNMGKDGSLVETFDWKFCPECGRKL